MSSKTKALTETLAGVPHIEAIIVEKSAPIDAVISLMRQKDVSCVMTCENKKPNGIFTERDFLMKVVSDSNALKRPIFDFMTPNPHWMRLSQSVGDAVELMNQSSLRHLPILDEKGTLAFVVTVDGLIRYLADHFPAAVMNRPPELHKIASEMDGA